MSDKVEPPEHFDRPASPAPDDNPFVVNSKVAQKAAGGETLRMVVVALAIVLFGLTLAVLFVLPKIMSSGSDAVESEAPVAQSTPQQAPEETPSSVEVSESTAPEALTSGEPPRQSADDTDNLKQREDAQSLLATADEKISFLETKNVSAWAADELQQVRADLALGEKAYSEQRYKAAINTYQNVIAALDQLVAQSDSVLTDSLAEGELALADGDSANARAAFENALLIEPDNSAALAGQKRAENLDAVLALVTEAAGFEELGETKQALDRYESALALDPKTTAASEAIARIKTASREKSFRAAMSRGFNALDKKNYNDARKHFKSATAIKPGDENAIEALTQAEELIKTQKIDSLLANANRKSQQEDWPAVEKSLLEAKRLDNSISGIDSRIATARSRQALTQQLAKYTSESHRLRSDAVHTEALAVIKKAKGIGSRGPKLTQQISTLEATILAARTPKTVTLTSDAATDITVYKVGKFGAFSTKDLSLLPGPYVVVGKRSGYRNVRLEFTVSATNSNQAFDVRCVEQLQFGTR